MTTSANVTRYFVKDKDGKDIWDGSQNCMCKNTITEKLKQHQPAIDFTIYLTYLDEEEEDHCTQEMSLHDFLAGVKPKWENTYYE